MNFPNRFIAAGTAYSSSGKFVPAPYIRKRFTLNQLPTSANAVISGLGFYELYVNGQRITKGRMAPYVSNPDHIVYYDQYDVFSVLEKGDNVVAFILGDGFQNNEGGYVWEFDTAPWRGAPQMAFRLECEFADGETVAIESNTDFKTAPSPLLYNDRHYGEYYDARKEIPGWNTASFDDSAWANTIIAPNPRGERRLCFADPIIESGERKPISITPVDDGYLYDFGYNDAGHCRLNINGTEGQEITLYHGEVLVDGKLYRRNLSTNNEYELIQKDIYTCKSGTQTWTPIFARHGFRYVFVTGLTPAQATPEALTYVITHSDVKERGGFTCSDQMLNTLQELTRRATVSNFCYYPLDCPQREKNGWTADAALSAEHILLNLNAEASFAEWLRNIRKAQREDGALPGIVPNTTWGYDKWTGPAWDVVLVWLPYYTYVYRGDKSILEENAHAILRYMDFLHTKIGTDGLIHFGSILGDWCPAGKDTDAYKSPMEFVNTLIGMDICEKAAFIFGELGQLPQQEFALSFYEELHAAARERLIDKNTKIAFGNCQTSQALALHVGLFEPGERTEAFNVLLKQIKEAGDCFDVGVVGARVLFHVLADFGEVDLALKLIIGPKFPSYGWWVEQGATTLWEQFPPHSEYISSQNHHFWGDISHFFIRHLAGIHYNPHLVGNEVDIRPQFASALSHAEGFYQAPEGEIRVRWERNNDEITLNVTVPDGITGYIHTPVGMEFADSLRVKPVKTGEYKIKGASK